MHAVRRWLGAALLASTAFAASGAMAATFTQLYVFGDSLADPGNAAALTGGINSQFFPTVPPSVDGRFSNGPTAAEQLAQKLGAPVTQGWPTPAGATNMAVGGALTGNGNYNYVINDPVGLATTPAYATVGTTGIAQQIAAFTGAPANAGKLADAGALTLLWGGPNDFFLGFAQAQASPPADPVAFFAAVTTQAAMNMAENIVALAMAGAKNILVPNMPDLGLTPALQAGGAGLAALASSVTDAYNFGLAQAIATAATNLGPMGVTLFSFNTAGYFRDAMDGTPPPGITIVDVPCIFVPGALEAGCPGFLFYDGVHPTTYAHALLADGFYNASVPEPRTYALLALGLLGLVWTARRRRA